MKFIQELVLKNSKYKNTWISGTPSGAIIYSDIAITHRKEHPTDPDRNLRIFQGMIEKDIPLDLRQKFYYARALYYHALYDQAIEEFTVFLDSGNGWIENNINACLDLANCFFKLNQPNKVLQALFRSFQFDVLRAEICCEIGDDFFRGFDYDTAIFWYNTAIAKQSHDPKMGFSSPDYYRFTPYLQLCVCHDKLGNFETAKKYHNKSKRIKPNHPAVKFNDNYFPTATIKRELIDKKE